MTENPDTPKLTAGQRIEGLRKAHGYTRAQFCRLTGIGVNQLENIERGLQKVPVEIYDLLRPHFPGSMQWLVFDDWEYNPTAEEKEFYKKIGQELLKKYPPSGNA